MLLSIIIPRYKEDLNLLHNLLFSINSQVLVDFKEIEVIISNDNPNETLYDIDFCLLDNLDIKIINALTNGGPSIARQRGIDIATGDFLAFYDADDTLFDVYSLYHIIGALKEDLSIDMLYSNIYEQPNVGVLIPKTNLELGFLQNKVINRKLLIEHNIKFSDRLRCHEDANFLIKVGSLCKQIKYLNYFTYLWKWNDKSIVRKEAVEGDYNDAYIYIKRTLSTYISSLFDAINFIKDKVSNEVLISTLLNQFDYVFILMNCLDWTNLQNYYTLAFNTLKYEMKPFWTLMYTIPTNVFVSIYNSEYVAHMSNIVNLPKMSIYDFMEELRK